MLSSINPSVALAYCLSVLAQFETQGELLIPLGNESGSSLSDEISGDGASWSKIFTTVTPDASMTVGYALLMMIVSVAHLSLAGLSL